MQRKHLRLLMGTALAGALLLTGALSAGADELISVGVGAATVDGSTADWDLDATDGSSDFIGAMYRSGGSDHDVLANLYGKAQDGVLYLLALSTDHTVDMSGPEVWVAFNDNSNKVFPTYVPVLGTDTNVVGWEAAVPLPEDGVTSINVHTNWDNGQTGALARGNGMVGFTIEEPPAEEPVCVEYTGEELVDAMADDTVVDAGTATLGGIPEDACEFELTFTSYDLPGGDIEPSADQKLFDTTETITVGADNNGDVLEIDLPDCAWLTALYTGGLVESGQLVDGIVIGSDANTLTAEELAQCTNPGGDEPPPGDDTPPPGDDTPPPGDDTPPPGDDTPPPADDDTDDVIIEDDDAVEVGGEVTDETVVSDQNDAMEDDVTEEETAVLGVSLDRPAAPDTGNEQLAATGLETDALLWLAMIAVLLGAGMVTSTRRFDAS